MHRERCMFFQLIGSLNTSNKSIAWNGKRRKPDYDRKSLVSLPHITDISSSFNLTSCHARLGSRRPQSTSGLSHQNSDLPYPA